MSVETGIAKAIWWLKLNTNIPIRVCEWCASGRRVERRGFFKYEHPVEGKWKRCQEPSWWILHPPKSPKS